MKLTRLRQICKICCQVVPQEAVAFLLYGFIDFWSLSHPSRVYVEPVFSGLEVEDRLGLMI